MAQQNATIADGATDSNDIPLDGAVAGCFQIPAAFDGTTITVKISIDGVNYTEVVEEAGETNPITVATSGTYALPIKTFSGKYMQLVADAQTADRTIPVTLRMRGCAP